MVVDCISMDLLGHEPLKWVEMVQGDIHSRKLKMILFSGKKAWNPPEDTAVVIRYRKASGVWGEYDTMPDGSQAWELNGNTLTVSMIPQITSKPGVVMLSVVFLKEEAVLHSFSVEIRVRENIRGNCSCDVDREEGYRYLTGFLPAPETGKAGQIIQIADVDTNGKVKEVTAVDLPAGSLGGSGGYYRPVVSQTDADTMQISFVPSSGDMPAGETVEVALPAGKDGADGITPEVSIFEGVNLEDNRKKVTIRVERHLPNNIIEIQSSYVLDGAQGDPGEDGKSAYEYAQDAGYTGSESAFAAKLAEEPLRGFTSEITPQQVYDAVTAGRNVVLIYAADDVDGVIFTGFVPIVSAGIVTSSGIISEGDMAAYLNLIGIVDSGEWHFSYNMLPSADSIPEIPDALPNPNALTFTGAATGTYDGSSAVTINIPNASDGSSGETIPEYVRAEAETVARIVNQHQSNDSIVFPFLTDAHCGFYQDKTNEAPKLAGQLLGLIGKRVPFDFIANGGDIANGAWDTTREMTYGQYEDYTELTIDAHKGVPAVWVPGNHDDAPYMATADRVTQKELFTLVGRRNRLNGAVCPNGCNYGYLDLENRSLRVIYLDTDDKRSWGTIAVGAGETAPEYLNAHNLSGEQLNWLATAALDFSDKENAGLWEIVVVSHVALNISGTITDPVDGTVYSHSTENAAVILNAYKRGSSGSMIHNGSMVSYDFASVADRAAVICAVHGHNHRFCSETLTGGILSVGCPNVMNGRERVSDDGNTYSKTAGTADGTSFCVITIDRENHVVYADCVGAGYDRNFPYTTDAPAYTNQIPISTDVDGGVYNGIGYLEGYRLGSGGTPSDQNGSYLTGFIPCKTGDVVYLKNMTFQYGIDSGLTSSNQRLSFYDSGKNHIFQTNASALGGVAAGVKDDDGIWKQFTVKQTMSGTDCSGAAYFRINGSYIGADSVITVNEPVS